MPTDKKLQWSADPKPIATPVATAPKSVTVTTPLVESIPIKIDNKTYTVNRILFSERNYVELIGFVQAGYTVEYLENEKLSSIKKQTS